MGPPGSVFSETLSEITATKLHELSKRRAAFEAAKAEALGSAEAQGTDAIQRLDVLLEGVKTCLAVKDREPSRVPPSNNIEAVLGNLGRFVAQARSDPCISQTTLAEWEQRLRRPLDEQSLKYEYASLCAELVNEWLAGDSDSGDSDVEMKESGFEKVDNAAKAQARADWERSLFEPAAVNVGKLQQYLESLFLVPARGRSKKSRPEGTVFRALGELRAEVEWHERRLSGADQFNNTNLKRAITGLLSSDLLSDEKREVLKDFCRNPMILGEISDVLNMRMASLETWSWGAGGVTVEEQLRISGVYNMRMHEDLLQAIFLQHIGVAWSNFFREKLQRIFFTDRRVWKKSRSSVSQDAKRRLGYYLGATVQAWPSAQSARRRFYRKGFTLAGLGRPRMQLASKAARKSAPSGPVLLQNILQSLEDDESDCAESEEDDDDEEEDVPKSRMKLKQRLLHLLSTDIAMAKATPEVELTAIHSSFDDWGPSLPHETILTVLKFFGASDTWLAFFTRFLQAPLKFTDESESAEARVRRRGTPSYHALSDMFGEVTLFCLDFAINQSTSGSHLWRVLDDFWFWSRDHDVAVTAWKTVQDFASATSTSINADKSGSVRISSSPDAAVTPSVHKSLPKGQIRWGFLQLSAQTGRFEIDAAMVDFHINELRTQLQSAKNTKSIFAFIQTWNTYASTFFTSNFGQPVNSFGRDHVDQMLATHGRIQREVFSGIGDGSSSSVVDHIKKTLHQRFGVDNVPDGFLFFPVEMGGLELKSPFIPLLLIRDSVLESPSGLSERVHQSEYEAYVSAKLDFLNGKVDQNRGRLAEPDWQPKNVEERKTFMSFKEFSRYQEEFRFTGVKSGAYDMFTKLMETPDQQGVQLDRVEILPALEKLKSQTGLQAIHAGKMDLYWAWIAMMHGPEVVDRFGGLNIVDPGLLPMGMVSLLRERKVTWQE